MFRAVIKTSTNPWMAVPNEILKLAVLGVLIWECFKTQNAVLLPIFSLAVSIDAALIVINWILLRYERNSRY